MIEFSVIIINVLYMSMCGYIIYLAPGVNQVTMALVSAGIIAVISIVGIMLPTIDQTDLQDFLKRDNHDKEGGI